MASKINNKDELRFRIKMAEMSERYEDMVLLVTTLVHNYETLNSEDQNFISSAYKHSVGTRRASLKALSNTNLGQKLIEQEASSSILEEVIFKKYKTKIEEELMRLCNDMIEIIDSILIKKSSSSETRIFNKKLKGDYLRYKSEALKGYSKKSVEDLAEATYKEAHDSAKRLLSPANTVLIGTALNYSVFLSEIKRDNHLAIKLCNATIEAAYKSQIETGKEFSNEGSKMIQLLRDNMTLWATQEKSKELRAV